MKIKTKLRNSFVAGSIALFLLTLSGVARGSDTDPGVQVLYENQSSPECLEYLQERSGEGFHETNGLKLNPDLWHRPVYRLYCGGGERRDFTAYDVIEFHFRSSEADPGNPTFYVKTWNQTSNLVSISDYIDGGLIDHTWRLVTIPLADLRTATWDLGNVESLNWNKDSNERSYYVDDIILRTTTPPVLITSGKDAPFPESNTVLRLTFNKRYDHKSVKELSNYTIVSNTDPSYERALAPLDTGIHYRVQRFTDSKTAVNRYQAFLKFPFPFKNWHEYTLKVEDIADPSGNLMEPISFSFTYDDTRLLNPNIKVNQVGYLPDRPKIGYVGGYSGDLGGGAWAVGENGAIFIWDDQDGWSKAVSPVSSTLRAVAAFRENRVWAVGEGGTLIQWDGFQWNRIESPTSEDLLAICFGPTNIGWAVGAGGTTIRFVDGAWTRVDTPTKQNLRAVWAGPDDKAWAVGDGGTILRWDGSQWMLDEQPAHGDLYAIHGPHKDWLWACGANGTVLLHSYGHWKVFQDTPGTSGILRSMTSDENGAVWIGGDDGLLWHKSGFGSSPFVTVDSGSAYAIHALTRQHGRQFWGVGKHGSLINRTSNAWAACANLGSGNLYGTFALGYGPLRLPDPPPRVYINDVETEKTAFSAPLVLRAANWRLSGEDLYAFDFSDLIRPGTYQACVPGIGLSDPFVIDADVLNHAAYTTARGLYYQRSGTPLTAPYAEDRFTRPMGHEYDPGGRKIDAIFHGSLPNTPLYADEIPGEMIDAHGGWHDAGDYGKYMPTAAAALWFLFTAYDLDPAKFRDDTLNIPESGNGVPDLLDEARWEVDWIARIQADDGAVYHKLTAETWFSGMPHEEESPRFLFEKTTHDTALAAAIFACASRLWRTFDAQLSEDYLNRAELAWGLLRTHTEAIPPGGFKNPAGTGTGEYNDADDADNRLWAAAELYRTTGKKEYGEYFEQWWANNDHTRGWNNWQHFYKCAYWAYLRANQPGANTDIQEDILNGVLRNADQLVTLTEQNPYHNGARLDVPDWIGWGAFTQSSETAFPLLQAWALSSHRKYLDAAALSLDAQLGANPLAFSFITGLGVRYPRDPLHKVSLYDGVDEPVPGIPVFGVFAHMSNSQPFYLAAQTDENSYPSSYATTDPYPILRRYVDAHELVPMSEFTIVDMAIAAAVFNLLAGTTGR